MSLNTENFQGYNFYRFWVTKEKSTKKVDKITPPTTTQIMINESLWIFNFFFYGQDAMLKHHKKCIFIIYNSAGRERNNFQQLSILIYNVTSSAYCY